MSCESLLDGSSRSPHTIACSGQTTTQLYGTLTAGASDSYVLWATKGELLEIRVDGVRGRDIVARLVEEFQFNSVARPEGKKLRRRL